jgi:hypothetical protein
MNNTETEKALTLQTFAEELAALSKKYGATFHAIPKDGPGADIELEFEVNSPLVAPPFRPELTLLPGLCIIEHLRSRGNPVVIARAELGEELLG